MNVGSSTDLNPYNAFAVPTSNQTTDVVGDRVAVRTAGPQL